MSSFLKHRREKMVTRKQWHDLFVNKIKITGSLKKRNSQTIKLLQRWNKRWFFLTEDVLAYAKSRKDSVMRGTIHVQDIREARKSNNPEEHEGYFEVVIPRRVLVLRCKSANQRNLWVDAINQACASLKQSNNPPRGSSEGGSGWSGKGNSVSEKSTVHRRGGLKKQLSVTVPDSDEEEEAPRVKARKVTSGQSLRERYGNGKEDEEETGSGESSDGYESGRSWNDSELEDMSPIPTPKDPRLWHPRFQSDGEEEDEDADGDLDRTAKVRMDATGELPVPPIFGRESTEHDPAAPCSSSGGGAGGGSGGSGGGAKTPVTPMNGLDLHNPRPPSIFREANQDRSVKSQLEECSPLNGSGSGSGSGSGIGRRLTEDMKAESLEDCGDVRPGFPESKRAKRSIKDTIKKNLTRKASAKDIAQKKVKLSPEAVNGKRSGTVKLYGNSLFCEGSQSENAEESDTVCQESPVKV